jgi:hypothetical protein
MVERQKFRLKLLGYSGVILGDYVRIQYIKPVPIKQSTVLA